MGAGACMTAPWFGFGGWSGLRIASDHIQVLMSPPETRNKGSDVRAESGLDLARDKLRRANGLAVVGGGQILLLAGRQEPESVGGYARVAEVLAAGHSVRGEDKVATGGNQVEQAL